MSHINYFEPYESKSPYHEDQLTRAFLIVLRYVPSALMLFYDSVIRSIYQKSLEKNKNIELPSISELDLSKLNFETQTQSVDDAFKTNKIISVLITDEIFNIQKPISKSDRNARYDGVIYFSSDITLIIENKPSHYNVWEEQLSPSAKSLPDDVEIIDIAAIIEWKSIIRNLNGIIKNNLISRAEKEIISDFLDFIDKNFPLLNPYDNFTDCKDNIELLNRRVKNLLINSIAINEEDVGYHNGWCCYFLKTPFPEIWMIGFSIKEIDEKDWKLAVEMWFGDTLSQSRELYKNKINFKDVLMLEKDGWEYSSNFHISFMQKHLVWLDTPEEFKKKYIQYWIDNISKIKQYSKNELNSLIKELENKNVIEINNEKKDEIKTRIMDTNRDKLYISPGIGFTFSFKSNFLKELDSKKELAEAIKNKIIEGLRILRKKIDFLK